MRAFLILILTLGLLSAANSYWKRASAGVARFPESGTRGFRARGIRGPAASSTLGLALRGAGLAAGAGTHSA